MSPRAFRFVLSLSICLSLTAVTNGQRAGSSIGRAASRGEAESFYGRTQDGGRIVSVEVVDDRKVGDEPNHAPTTHRAVLSSASEVQKRPTLANHSTHQVTHTATSTKTATRRQPVVRRIVPEGFANTNKAPVTQRAQQATHQRTLDSQPRQQSQTRARPASAQTNLSSAAQSRIQRTSQQEVEQVSAACADDGWSSGEIYYDSGIEDACGCGGGSCSSGLGGGGCGGCGRVGRWSAGVEFAVLKPHFSNNVAFTTVETTANSATHRETLFNYDSKIAPRIWVAARCGDNLGLRFHYWQFNYNSDSPVGTPGADGFRVFHPDFLDIDLSSSTPDSEYRAGSNLNAYVFDLEGTMTSDFCSWRLDASTGLRFADIEQSYTGVLINEQGRQQGNIFFQHDTQGVGPTFSLRATRPFFSRFKLFGMARGSLIYGESVTLIRGVEDEDLDTEFTSNLRTERDKVLPIGEMQVGFEWVPPCFYNWHPYVHVALEGQVWNDVGNATNEIGDLGFSGVNVAVGFDW